MKRAVYLVKEFLNRPVWLLIFCSVVVFTHLVFDGTIVSMWHLYNSRKVLENRIMDIQVKNTLVKERLNKLSDSQFLEREVRDRFNLVGEKDIVFIFADEPTKKDELTKKRDSGSGE